MVNRYDCSMDGRPVRHFVTDDGPWVSYDDHAKEIATLRAEVERLRAKVTELSDEAYEYAEQVEKAERERDEAKGRVFRRDDFIIELQHEIESARDAARGENALRLEVDRERDTLRAQLDAELTRLQPKEPDE